MKTTTEFFIRWTEMISVHFSGKPKTGKGNRGLKMTGNSKTWMVTKWARIALLEVIPPRFCVTFRRASFCSRPKTSKSRHGDGWAEHTINTGSESYGSFSEKVKNPEHQSKLDSCLTLRAENQGIWMYKVLPTQSDSSWPPKVPDKIQNRSKKQWTSPAKVYIQWFRQPYHSSQICNFLP